jgi:hypothetical protein
MTSKSETKKYMEENLLLKKQIEERTGKTVEQLYQERDKRVRDAIALKKPDRVPFSFLVEVQSYATSCRRIGTRYGRRRIPGLW